MKQIFAFILLFPFFLFSQSNNSIEKIDSIDYFRKLRTVNVQKNKYKEALINTHKAILYCKENGNLQYQADETFSFGKLYYDVKKNEDAIQTFDECIILYKSLNPSPTLAAAYYYQGLCFMRKKLNIQAFNCFENAKNTYNQLKINTNFDSINLSRGIVYKSQGNIKAATSIFNFIVAKPDSTSNVECKSEAYLQIGAIEMQNKRYNSALNYLNKALNLNSKIDNLEQKSAILLLLSDVYENLLDKNNAYYFLKQYSNSIDYIINSDNRKLGIEDYESFKEIERISDNIQGQEQIEQQEKANKFSKLISILAIALISILSLLSLALYKNNIIRTQTNILLEEKNRELIIAKESAEKASKARSEFLSTVSHELRTPLNAINGIAHLLLEDNPKKSQLNYLHSLQFSGNYLTTFINEILEIQKIDSKKIEIEQINFNLKVLAENLKNSLKELASANKNDFIFEIDPNIPDNLIGDPTKLSQIFINLINNALKFTKNGTVKLIIKLISIENKKVCIYFEVKDNGIGIPKDKFEAVFNSFSQGSIGINRKYGGTGLGLTIVKKITEILGGEIKLESTVGVGTSFSFELQFKEGEKLKRKDVISNVYDDSCLKNKTILLVEDNKINQMISKKMLENKGVFCEIVDNGEEAIEIVRHKTFDLILMDVHLPGINGTIASQEIRKFNHSTPIIALTAISLNENREMLLSYGINDVITKPFVPDDFYSIIANYIT